MWWTFQAWHQLFWQQPPYVCSMPPAFFPPAPTPAPLHQGRCLQPTAPLAAAPLAPAAAAPLQCAPMAAPDRGVSWMAQAGSGAVPGRADSLMTCTTELQPHPSKL